MAMMNWLTDIFRIEKKPTRSLMAFEWVVVAYLFATLAFVLVRHDVLPHADGMIWGRLKILTITIAMWGVYRMLPCRFTRITRVVVQMALLSWWYPDLFELNRTFPNLDHLFASWEQALFGCQPALLFSKHLSHPVFSELMCLGYWSYYPLMALLCVTVFFCQPANIERVMFIIMGTFFIHYVIFVVLPVAGPQFYYEAVGTDKIAQGIFPNLHDHFNHQQVRMACPGYRDGLFYALVESAHQAGERPVAAFPSSHVSVTTVIMLCAWHFRLRRLFWVMAPFAVLLFFSTVYIFAHYAIDALAGLVSGALCWWLLLMVPTKTHTPTTPKKKPRKR